jgi:hypothetical protein
MSDSLSTQTRLISQLEYRLIGLNLDRLGHEMLSTIFKNDYYLAAL